MFNVNISGCDFSKDRADALASEYGTSSVAGGGCVSILFRGNATGSRVRISDNQFLECNVYVQNDVLDFSRGNGIYELPLA